MADTIDGGRPAPQVEDDDTRDEPLGSPEEPTDAPDEPADAPGPPPWTTLDGSIVQLAPTRLFCPGGRLRPRRRTLRSLGRLVRRARRVGTVRSRRGRSYPVFRTRSAGRPFRLVTRRRGLRHEIVYVAPEDRGEMEVGRARGRSLREAARAAFFHAYPRLKGKPVQVHHRIPLEWMHLFPKADPNRLSNLQGLTSRDHLRKATDLWTAFRNAHRWARRKVTPAEVLRYAALVDRSLHLPYPL